MSKSSIQADIEKILEIYKKSGRFSVTVEALIEKQENSRVKVIFSVTEGPKTAIRNVYFVGNENYHDSELRTIVLSKETAWYKFLDSNDTYDPDRMEYDKELLREFYHSVGFADARVISATAELSPTKTHFTLIYSVEEGQKYKLGKIEVNNQMPDIDTTSIAKLITAKEGDTFNMTALEKIGEKISESLSDKGYPQVSVSPELTKDRNSQTVGVTFLIEKADKVFINKINITGNPKTSEKVIRREFKLQEGDVYNNTRKEKSERALRNLDYFEKISVQPVPTKNAGRYDLNVDVQEKSTASISLDFGYNSQEGPFGQISLLERNLLGTGRIFNGGIHKSRKSITYSAGITDPHFMDKDLSLGVNFFNSKTGVTKHGSFGNAEQPYSVDTIGTKLNLGYDITDDLYHSLGYTIKKDDIKDGKDKDKDKDKKDRYISLVEEQTGKYTTSAIDHTLTYDRLDSRIIPKNGYIFSGSQAYAGLGGTNHYFKNEVDGKYFKSFFNNKVTLKLVGEAGIIQGTSHHTVRLNDRFRVGDTNLRGFAPGGIGPRDKKTGEGLGGQKYYTFTTELNFPVGLPEEMNFTGAAFVDVGALWGFDISKKSKYKRDQAHDSKAPRVSAGVGFIWITKIAPIRIDWALPLRYKKYDEQQRFHIRMTTHF